MSESLRLNHIFKVLVPCGRGCAGRAADRHQQVHAHPGEKAAAGVTPHGAIYNKVSVWSDAGKTTERLKIQSLGCFAYDSEVSTVLII